MKQRVLEFVSLVVVLAVVAWFVYSFGGPSLEQTLRPDCRSFQVWDDELQECVTPHRGWPSFLAAFLLGGTLGAWLLYGIAKGRWL